MRTRPALIALAALAALSGCATGAGGFGAAGELEPSQFAAPDGERQAVAGIVGGGLVGGALGGGLSAAARQTALAAEYRALEATPAGEPVTWTDPNTGRSGRVTAAQPYQVGSQNCRQYSHEIASAGETQRALGTACRNDDGSWTLLG
ncbi:RT0821/Lpp0805 family surface protein [Aquibium sp. A9E412]|uniref:RT0821/Lpp0805 family surface protein n=1 Tax=Aquibium sp. A9E412 TaxID=2976767 RepID=UPI0025AEF9CF|nr:RT0821/Lpp0805 family surface protein [Aquibium sp. A9E412]MDN2568004.1 RT0821/Lpp0805 family surface protein [Aquibium sp. A9E412]